MHSNGSPTESFSSDGLHNLPPPSPLHDDLTAILQREQKHALSLLNSSPLLAGLFIAYSRSHGVSSPNVIVTPPEGMFHPEVPNMQYSSLQTDYAQLGAKYDQVTRQHVKDAETIQSLKANLNYFTTAYSESKANHEKTLRDKEDLLRAHWKLQEEHDHVSKGGKDQLARMEALVADWNAQCDTFNRSAADRHKEYEDYKRQAALDLDGARMEALDWKTKYDELDKTSSLFQDGHRDCTSREDLSKVQNALDGERVQCGVLTQSLIELQEKHDALRLSLESLREHEEHRLNDKPVNLASQKEDVVQHEIAEMKRKHRQELNTLENLVGEFQCLYHDKCEELNLARERIASYGACGSKSHSDNEHDTRNLAQHLDKALAELSQWRSKHSILIKKHAADIEAFESRVSELDYQYEEKCEELRGIQVEYEELQSLVHERVGTNEGLGADHEQEDW